MRRSSGTSQARICDSEINSSPSAIFTTRSDASVPSCWTVNAPSSSSVTGTTPSSTLRSLCCSVIKPCRSGTLFGSAESAIAVDVFLARRPQIPTVVVGPQLVLKHVLGVRGLPDHEVARPLLARCPQEQVDVGNVRALQMAAHRRLGDPVGAEPAFGHFAADCGGRFRDFGT